MDSNRAISNSNYECVRFSIVSNVLPLLPWHIDRAILGNGTDLFIGQQSTSGRSEPVASGSKRPKQPWSTD